MNEEKWIFFNFLVTWVKVPDKDIRRGICIYQLYLVIESPSMGSPFMGFNIWFKVFYSFLTVFHCKDWSEVSEYEMEKSRRGKEIWDWENRKYVISFLNDNFHKKATSYTILLCLISHAAHIRHYFIMKNIQRNVYSFRRYTQLQCFSESSPRYHHVIDLRFWLRQNQWHIFSKHPIY